MKIYLGHSREFDYESELYLPIRADAQLKEYEIILPHENGQAFNWGKDFYGTLDLFIAEVSFPATGLGIELGWAYDAGVPIVCIFKAGMKVSSSLRAVTDKFYEYNNAEELCQIIETATAQAKNFCWKSSTRTCQPKISVKLSFNGQ